MDPQGRTLVLVTCDLFAIPGRWQASSSALLCPQQVPYLISLVVMVFG